MKKSTIFALCALFVGALAVAAYTIGNTVSSTEEASQQAIADVLNSTEPAAGAMDGISQQGNEEDASH